MIARKQSQKTRVLFFLLVVVALLPFSNLPLVVAADPLTAAWSNIGNYATAIGAEPCVTYLGYVYCIGGQTGGATYTTAVKYATISGGVIGAWQTSANPYPVKTAYHSCTMSSDYIVCVGGAIEGSGTGYQYNSTYAAQIQGSHDIGSWTKLADFPIRIDMQSCFVVSGYIYCIGGYTWDATANNKIYNATISGSTIGTWGSKSLGVDLFNCRPYNGSIYCVGNAGGGIGTKYATLSGTTLGTLNAGPDYPETPQMFSQSCQIYATSGDMICVGGDAGTGDASVYYSSLLTGGMSNWTASARSYPVAISYSSCLIVSTVMYCIGGESAGAFIQTMYATTVITPTATMSTTRTITTTISTGTVITSLTLTAFNTVTTSNMNWIMLLLMLMFFPLLLWGMYAKFKGRGSSITTVTLLGLTVGALILASAQYGVDNPFLPLGIVVFYIAAFALHVIRMRRGGIGREGVAGT